MDVILLQRIEKLGQMGDLVTVKDGFARNYLLPQGKALRATEENRQHFDAARAQLEADNLERRQEAEAVAKRMQGLSIVMLRQAGETGQLYGSVNAQNIAQGVTEAGFTIERRQVVLDRAIKVLGLHPAHIVLHPEVTLAVTVNVARSEEEARLQASGVDAATADRDEGESDESEADQLSDMFEQEARPDIEGDEPETDLQHLSG